MKTKRDCMSMIKRLNMKHLTYFCKYKTETINNNVYKYSNRHLDEPHLYRGIND